MTANIRPVPPDRELPSAEALAALPGVLEAIYAATLAADCWPAVMQAAATLVGTGKALFIQMDRNLPSASVTESFGIAAEHVQAIRARDPEQDRIWQAVLKLPADTVARATELWPGDMCARGPLHATVAVAGGMLYGLTANLENNAAYFTNISFLRAAPDFTAAEVATLKLLVPHLRTALTINRHIVRAEAGRREALLRFDRVRQAMVLLDRSGYAIYTSKPTHDLLHRTAGLALRHGRFIFDDLALQAEFERMVRLTIAGQDDETPQIPHRMRVSRPGATTPVGLSIISISRSIDRALLTDGTCCMVLIHDIAGLNPLPIERLSWLYDLTPAEARICEAMYRTGSIDATALELHLTRHTVRSHLKAVYVKFGVGTQAQLMQRLANAARLAEHGIERLRY
ncbi:MAG: helix-turn-helix transcriptional regulator [Gammaproteobacteria bacterium]|nr:helix-turn-helix transcriptional regulator [Gammaproteobacteria bacterium]